MNIIASVFIVFLSSALIINPQIAINGLHTGYVLCFEVLFPSLFPFMILSEITILTPVGSILSFFLKPFIKLLKLPSFLTELFFASAIGGYPTGSKLLSISVDNNDISAEQASEFLPFLINAGPGFVIMAVGRIMFNSLRLGVIFYFSQIISSLLCGRFFYKGKNFTLEKKIKKIKFSKALICSVSDSIDAMMIICSNVFLFSVLSSFLSEFLGKCVLSDALTSIMEVTFGCKILSKWQHGILATAFLISFSGISVILQVSSICQKSEIKTDGILAKKLICGIFSIFITAVIIKFFPLAENVGNITVAPLEIYSQDRLLSFFCMMSMFSMIAFKCNNTLDEK